LIRLRRAVESLAAVAAVFLAWDLYVRLFDVPSFLLPSPGASLAALAVFVTVVLAIAVARFRKRLD